MSRPLLLGGVALASVLGAGVGLWARPNAIERPGAVANVAPTASPARADRRLAIIVDATPAPTGKPLEVLAPSPPRPAIAPPAAAEPVAPRRPTGGLVRVLAPTPRTLAPAVGHKSLPAATPAVAAETGETAPATVTPVHRNAPAKARTLIKAKLQKASTKAKPEKLHARKAEMAETDPKSRHGLKALAHAFTKLAPHHARTTELADAAPPHRRVAEARLVKAEPVREKPAAAAAPIKVSAVQPRCASADPGEALVCGDPSLSAAERRLNRAYHDAQAAGVPTATLERQQQRWRAARAAAAREAPWAVRQVYQARIAELQDQARDARGD